ncbi:NIPSNAP family protein [Mumia quercus]|uniref:NIPSNAP family protein n=1 Tax=Mumia quercus TaxID=2976125 RepID=UPI0021D177A9|nr:NIPSNAP family protein [Mumia quercus]
MTPRTALVELRRYDLHPGQREVLISLFDAELVETQEAVGISVLGQFRDLDRPDQFVWMRGFEDAESRGRALQAFYGGPAWAQHRDAANATMTAFDDVLLLRPAPDGALALPDGGPPSGGLVAATVYQPDDLDAFTALMAEAGEEALTELGARRTAAYVSADVVNTFPVLPVRDDAAVYVRIARFASAQEHAAHRRRLEAAAASDELLATLRASVRDELRLVPTDRSLLR